MTNVGRLPLAFVMCDTEQDNKYTTQEDFEHAQLVSRKYNINILGSYHDIYILLDVLLCVFEEFHTLCIKVMSLGLHGPRRV